MSNLPRIRYLFTYPLVMPYGGASLFMLDTIKQLQSQGLDVKPFDITSTEIDYDVLLVYNSTYHSPEMLRYIRSRGVKIILVPIYDREKPLWMMKLLKPARFLPFLNIQKLREMIFNSVSEIVVHNNSELKDLHEIYRVPQSKLHMFHIPINPAIIELDKTVTKDLFVEQYGWQDFVFCPAATVSRRKNQISLIKALKGTGLKLVINNTQSIEDNLEEEFRSLVKDDPNILCLEKLSLEMLVSAYKAAKLSVSVSLSETAGLVNLEAGYLGCRLVVSDLPALREYLQGYATFIDQHNVEAIRRGVLSGLEKDYDPTIRDFILNEYTWGSYLQNIKNLF